MCLARQCVGGANEFASEPLEGGCGKTKYLCGGEDATRHGVQRGRVERKFGRERERVRAVARVPSFLILLIPVAL